ncbi:MAG: MFS transporter [Pseudomonadota bacterium]
MRQVCRILDLTTPPLTTDTPHDTSWRAVLTDRHAPALALVCLAIWLHAGDSLIVATMLPSIVAEVGGEELVACTYLLYVLASVVAGSAAALMTMRFGLRAPMATTAIVFGIGCLVSALAPNMPVILIGGLLQGIGGGVLASLAFIATREIFPSHLFPKAIAAMSTLWGASAFHGPLLGGVFVELANWRWCFAAFAAQAGVLAIFVLLQKDQMSPKAEDAPGVPWKGLLVLTSPSSPSAWLGVDVEPLKSSTYIAFGILLFVAFLRLDARASSLRMLPQAPFSLKTPTGAALLMVFGLSLATVTNTIYGTLLLSRIHGVCALGAGYVLACGSIGWSIAAFAFSNSREALDARLIVTGTSIITATLVGFDLIFPSGPVWAIAALSLANGAGFGMCWGFVLRRATALAHLDEGQRVTGAIAMVQRIGYAFGAAFIGMVGNAFGFEATRDAGALGRLASLLFLACLPFANLDLGAMARFVTYTTPTSHPPKQEPPDDPDQHQGKAESL